MPALRRANQSVHPKPLTVRHSEPIGEDPLRFTRPRTAHEAQREAIVDALLTCPHTTAELIELLNRKTFPREAMDALVAEGLIETTGRGPGSRWRLTEHGRAVSTAEEVR